MNKKKAKNTMLIGYPKFISKNFLEILKYHLTIFCVCINIILNGRKKI